MSVSPVREILDGVYAREMESLQRWRRAAQALPPSPERSSSLTYVRKILTQTKTLRQAEWTRLSGATMAARTGGT